MPSAKKHPYILPFFCTAQFTFNCILKDYLVIKACKEVEEQVSILLELEKYEWWKISRRILGVPFVQFIPKDAHVSSFC